MTRDRRIIVVQVRDGGRYHGVLVAGDANGITMCRRKFSGALVVPDGAIDCKECLRRGYL